jgi:hypothetical protein
MFINELINSKMAETTISPQFSEAAKGAFSRFHPLELAKQKFAEYVWDSGVKSGGPEFFEALLWVDPGYSITPKQSKARAEWLVAAKADAGATFLLTGSFPYWWKDVEEELKLAEEVAAIRAAAKAAKLAADKKALEEVD